MNFYQKKTKNENNENKKYFMWKKNYPESKE